MAIRVEDVLRREYKLPNMILQSGQLLSGAVLAYETFGRLSASRDNAILVCHALTGDTHAGGTAENPGWWEGLIGPGKAIDTNRYFVICANVLGGCYGSTGPGSINPADGRFYGMRFPTVTIRDMVHAQYHLVRSFGIDRLYSVIGGSMGGMQVFEWAVTYPDMVETYIPLATAGKFSSMGIAFNNVMRQAIYNDPEWLNGDYYGITFPEKGLNLARRLGMITYRSFDLYEERFGLSMVPTDDPFAMESEFQVEKYLSYQGKKLVQRFDANTYLYLLKAMDLHDISRGRGDYKQVLDRIKGKALMVGIDSDFLFPARELFDTAELLKAMGKQVIYREMQSIHGHDAFLIEFEIMNEWVGEFLESGGSR
ncbi:homoserine O-acetyltransferase MetX [Effusibacillus lacus]|uniref:Homoserine O-acetyltransferase n=1 Tax=Effusibacillus lacus TaxID=1348429 RepID=A0A292YQB7_9BACL|nr:homoserine O-acetyltransferase [Effusibacillus lacus]TCS70062.1 homoserine O-acetyltransferase [Effusibacillus lacus]GAX91099.1 homoserine O-acetyltransferase [Effusibacillus lacus]